MEIKQVEQKLQLRLQLNKTQSCLKIKAIFDKYFIWSESFKSMSLFYILEDVLVSTLEWCSDQVN